MPSEQPHPPPFPFTDTPADSTLASSFDIPSSSANPGSAKELSWPSIRAFKVYTLVFVLKESEKGDVGQMVLLGLKRRGAFTGMYGPRARQQLVLARTDDISFLCAWSTRWNGFGGKVEPSDQSIAAAALRELDEEAGIRATDLRYRGRVVFGPGEVDADVSVDMRLFSCTAFEGEVTASEEMGLPLWHRAQLPVLPCPSSALTALPPLPTGAMHEDALLYLPHIFAGRLILARFDYARPKQGAEDGTTLARGLERWWIGELVDGASSGVGSEPSEWQPTG